MVSSMTAFARESGEGEWGKATWELRSVNHRYLDVTLRLPEELRALESAVREHAARALRRGKVDCTLRFEATAGADHALTVNAPMLGQLAGALATVRTMLPDTAPANALDVLRWPGVVAGAAIDAEHLGAPLLALLDRALQTLVRTRQREGDKLQALIAARCAAARAEVVQLREQMPAILAEVRERLQGRLAELREEFDAARLEQEIALYAAKLDVAEELDRLDAHLEEVVRVLGENDAIGRRLDFLMQELHREANTLGSKSAHLASTAASVELKVLIEQMREQVQNIE